MTLLSKLASEDMLQMHARKHQPLPRETRDMPRSHLSRRLHHRRRR